MPNFSELPRAILTSISVLSGDGYREVGGDDLLAELKQRGLEPPVPALIRLMHQLKDAGYLSCTFLGGTSGVEMIRLDHLGRQEVEGWPAVPGQPSENDVKALIDTLEARSEDPEVPEPERSKARAAASAIKELGVNVTGQVLAAWLKHVTGVG